MRSGKAVTIYLSDIALEALDKSVEERAAFDRAEGLKGYSVTNRSKLISQIVEEYLLKWDAPELSISKISEVVAPIFKDYGVRSAKLFGSYARGEQTSESDIDILVDRGEVEGLEFFKLQRTLSDALGKHVDLQSVDGGNKEFLDKVEQECVVLYAS